MKTIYKELAEAPRPRKSASMATLPMVLLASQELAASVATRSASPS